MVALRWLIILVDSLALAHRRFHFPGLDNQHCRRCSPVSDSMSIDSKCRYIRYLASLNHL